DGGDGAQDAGEEPEEPAAGLQFGYPVYTQAEIDAWSTSSPQYAALAGSWAGNVNRAVQSYSPVLSETERDLLKDQSVYIKVQAVLFAADGNPARKAKVAARSEEHTSELQSRENLVCRLLLEKKKKQWSKA